MHCHLLIPDLLPRRAITPHNDPLHGVTAPALQALLARSHKHQGASTNMESWLCETFAVEYRQEYPIASLCALAQGLPPENAYWLRADPVHLAVERDQLVLEQAPIHSLPNNESTALIATLNQHFAEDGLHFLAPSAKHWYLRLDKPAAISTQTLHQALGQNIHPLLPAGPEAMRWRALLNEIQMLLYTHPVNAAREARGEAPVNSIWPWGGGILPNHLHAPFDQVWANDPLLHGLAMVAGIAHQILPEGAAEWLGKAAPGNHLLLLDALRGPACYGDPQAWREQLMRLEQQWFMPLKQAVQRGNMELTLHVPATAGTSSFFTHRGSLWKLWRPAHPLTRYRPAESS